MRRLSASIIVFALSTANVCAADLHFLPPAEAVDRVLSEHPIVTRALAEMDAAKADSQRLRSGPHEFQIDGGVGTRTVNNIGNYTVWDVTLSRGLRIGGKAELDEKAGALGVEHGSNAIEDAKHETAIQLLVHWMDWLEAEGAARIDEAEMESYAGERAAVTQRVVRLDAAQRDADLADAAYTRAAASTLAARGTVNLAQAALRRMFPEMALPPSPPEIAAPEAPALPMDRWFDLILERSHEIRMAELEAARQQTLASRAVLDRMPDPRLGVRAYSEDAGVETGVALVFSMPIGGAGRTAAADLQAAKARAAIADLARIKRGYEMRAQQDVVRAQSGLSAWRQAALSRDSAAVALARTRRGYELGEFDLSELLLVARQNFDAQRSELGARAEAQRALLQLQIDGHELWVLHDEGES